MLYAYGLKLGTKLMLHGHFRDALPYLIQPVNYWRTVEYRAVWREAKFHSADQVLDIGSPKLLSIYLADVVGAKVTATDIEDYFVKRMTLIRSIAGISPDKLRIMVEDGRNLGFADASFDKVYSISVLEHIPDTGDTACAREIKRVLKDRGQCFLTVPFSPESRVEYKDATFYWAGSSAAADGGKVFFQRRYSERDLFERLIEPSGLTLKKLNYIGENVMTSSKREANDYLPTVSGPIHPLLSRVFHTEPVASWQTLKKPLCACIVLEK